MTMRSAVVAFLMLAALAACSGEQPPAPADEPSAPEGALEEPVAPAEEVTLGDVEQTVFINATIAEADRAPSVKVDEIEDRRKRVTLVTVDVYQPYPEDLPISYTVDSRRNWKETPVVVRGRFIFEGRPETFGDFHTLLGEFANRGEFTKTVDLMDHLPEVPETVLVLVRAEGLLMEPGTDEKAIDPATATVPEDRIANLMSNPIRINFHNEPMPVTAAPETTPTSPVGAPAPAAPEAAPAPVAPEAAPAPAAPETAPATEPAQ